MSVHSEHRNGALVFYEGHRHRIVDAVGKNVIKYDLQPWALNATTVDPSGFTATVVEAGAGATEFDANNTAGRVGTITAAANEDDGGQYQMLGEITELTSDQVVYFRAVVQLNDATQSDLLVGLCITDTTLLGGMTDGVYFEKLDGSLSVSCVTEQDSSETQTDSVGTMADDTDIDLEIYFDGSSVYFYVDGSAVAIHTANIPDDEALTLSLAFLTGEAVANTCNIKEVKLVQIGR